jgi:hypothetical protein
MLKRTHLELLWNIEIGCRRCIRSASYFKTVSGTNLNLWAFTQNCFGGICVIHWCQIFGSRSEPTHYSKLFDDVAGVPFSKDKISDRLRNSVEMTEIEYQKFWEEVKRARDGFLVHNEFGTADRPVFPDLDCIVSICLEMRNIILEIVNACQSEDPKYQQDIKHFMTHYTNDTFLSEIKKDLPKLSNAVLMKKELTEQGH